MDGGGDVRAVDRRGPWATVLVAALAWFGAVLVPGAIGALVGWSLPCDRGLMCLNNGFYGALVGAAAGLLGLWLLAVRRLGMAWWWVPTGVALVALGLPLGELTVPAAGIAMVLAAPVLAGLVSLRGDVPDRARGLAGLGVLVLAVALAAGAWWLVDLRDQRERVAEIEVLGIGSYAPTGRDDLAVSRLYSPRPEDGLGLRYSLVRRGQAQSWIQVESRAPGTVGCDPARSSCQEAGEGITVATVPQREAVTVYRDLGDAVVRIGPFSGSDEMHGWTEEELVRLARDLRPVEPAWVVRRADRD